MFPSLRIFQFIFLLFFWNVSFSQTDFCGTEDHTPEELALFHVDIGYKGPNATGTTASGMLNNYDLPIHLFIINDNNGNPPNENVILEVSEAIDYANQVFTNGIQFYLCSISGIDNTSLQVTDDASVLNAADVDNEAISLYYIKDLDQPFATPAFSPYNVVAVDEGADVGILAHELGHYFGLDHTFANTVFYQNGVHEVRYTPTNACNPAIASIPANCCRELEYDSNGNLLGYVSVPCDGTNSGDQIPDTPVDPYVPAGLNNSPTTFSPCKYNQDFCINPTANCDVTSPGGMTTYTYNPDRTNIMSYYTCLRNFSPEQLNVMKLTLINEPNRAFLIDATQPTCNLVASNIGNIYRGAWDAMNFSLDLTPMPSVNIDINASNDLTNVNGVYDPASVYSLGTGTVTFGPANNTSSVFNAKNGVSTLDLIKIQKHNLGTEVFDNPYQLIAADVTNNGVVSISDLIQVQKIILEQITEFVDVDSWRFIPQMALPSKAGYYDTGFGDFENELLIDGPFNAVWVSPDGPRPYNCSGTGCKTYFDQVITSEDYGNINSEKAWNFIGIKSGDVNFTATLTPSSSRTQYKGIRSLSFLQPETSRYQSKNQCLKAGDEVIVYIQVKSSKLIEQIFAYQLGLEFNRKKLEYLGLEKGDANYFDLEGFNVNSDALENGSIKTVWIDPSGERIELKDKKEKNLFAIRFKVIEEVCQLEREIWMDEKMEHQFYDINEEKLDLNFKLKYNKTGKSSNFGLRKIYPNPVSEHSIFTIYSDINQEVEIQIFDRFGNSVSKQIFLEKGENQIENNLSKFSSGILVYTITNQQKVAISGQFIKIKE